MSAAVKASIATAPIGTIARHDGQRSSQPVPDGPPSPSTASRTRTERCSQKSGEGSGTSTAAAAVMAERRSIS